MNLDILVTTYQKSTDEIIKLIKSNICKGHVLVGNQGSVAQSYKEYKDNNVSIQIFNLTNKGVSKNRNYLLKQSKAKFVMFFDDDIKITNDYFRKINIESKENIAYRFNLKSENTKRPIKQLRKNGFVNFKELTSFGAWGIIFNRHFLIEHKLFFNETIGPGSLINHGEDTLFLRKYLKKGKIKQFDKCCFLVAQNDSTWQGENRNLWLELFSHGYVYRLLFGNSALFYLFLSMAKNYKNYKNFGSFYLVLKTAKYGLKIASKIEKNKINSSELIKIINNIKENKQ